MFKLIIKIIPIIIHLTIFFISLAVDKLDAAENREFIFSVENVQQQKVYEPVFGGQTYVYETGKNNPKTIVLVHGVGEEAASIWIELMEVLADSYHVVAFDLPGFGKSNFQNVLYSPEKYSKFIKWLKDRHTSRPIIILGHSLGGTLVLHFAATYPDEVESLVIVDAVGILHPVAYSKNFLHIEENENWPWLINKSLEKPFFFVNKLIDKLIEKIEDEDSSIKIDTILNNDLLRKVFLGGKPNAIAGLAAANFDFSQLIEKVKAPTLIIWGENDNVAPLRTAKILSAKLPLNHLEIIRQTGHVPMIEKKDIFNRTLLKFLTNPYSVRWSLKKNDRTPPIEMQGVCRKQVCRNQSNLLFSGYYQEIEINNCSAVRIENVIAKNVSISDSEVFLENCSIVGKGIGLKVVRSDITATNLTIISNTALYASLSRFDLAGGEIVGKEAAIVSPDKSFFIFSIGHIKSPYTDGYIHGIKNITPEVPL